MILKYITTTVGVAIRVGFGLAGSGCQVGGSENPNLNLTHLNHRVSYVNPNLFTRNPNLTHLTRIYT